MREREEKRRTPVTPSLTGGDWMLKLSSNPDSLPTKTLLVVQKHSSLRAWAIPVSQPCKKSYSETGIVNCFETYFSIRS